MIFDVFHYLLVVSFLTNIISQIISPTLDTVKFGSWAW